MSGPESPIVILSRRDHFEHCAHLLRRAIPILGVMLPYTPLHHILMNEIERRWWRPAETVRTNPLPSMNTKHFRRLHGIADFFLVHNRPIRRHADDSIVRIILGREQILRRARGYAPAADYASKNRADGLRLRLAVI